MTDYLNSMWTAFTAWMGGLFADLMAFLNDLVISTIAGVTGAIASLFEAIPVPDFLTNGLGYYLSMIDPSVLYFLSRSGLPEAFAILGIGITFRLTRKAFTLGQW